MAHPDAGFVAAFGGAVEPLVDAPEAVQAARVGGIGVVDDAVFQRERAHPRSLAGEGGGIGSGSCRDLLSTLPRRLARRRFAPVVVFDALRTLLVWGE